MLTQGNRALNRHGEVWPSGAVGADVVATLSVRPMPGQRLGRTPLTTGRSVCVRSGGQRSIACCLLTWTVQPLVFRLVCRNGLIASDQALCKTHVGRALGAETDSVNVYRDDTLAAYGRAFFLKVRDVVEAAVSETTFRLLALKIQKTRAIPLIGDPFKAVEVLANRYTLNDTEWAGVLRNLIVEGDLTAYGLVNAVTHYLQEVADYDRATDFEAQGGKGIDLPGGDWGEVVTAG